MVSADIARKQPSGCHPKDDGARSVRYSGGGDMRRDSIIRGGGFWPAVTPMRPRNGSNTASPRT
jgi:hypothetical protein